MVVGYFLASIFGLVFTILLALNSRVPLFRHHLDITLSGFNKYFDSLIYFSSSIQIASSIVLIRKDFGISANGLGGFTVQITWAVALLCMLPLLYPMMIIPHYNGEGIDYRFGLFGACWFLWIYPFVSSMIGAFAPSQVGAGGGPGGVTIVTDDEWTALTMLCMEDVNDLSKIEEMVLKVFGAAGGLLVTLYGLASLLWFIVTRLPQLESSTKDIRKHLKALFPENRRKSATISFLVVILPTLTTPPLLGYSEAEKYSKAAGRGKSGCIYGQSMDFWAGCERDDIHSRIRGDRTDCGETAKAGEGRGEEKTNYVQERTKGSHGGIRGADFYPFNSD